VTTPGADSAEIHAAIPDQAGRSLVRVAIADPASSARRALAALVGGIPGAQVVAEVGGRAQLGDVLRAARPDVLLIDDRLLSGAGHVLQNLGPQPEAIGVVVLGLDDHPGFAARARRLGAQAWVAKDLAAEELPALLAVLSRR
jgi:DNA-binding NarL/FixJ family response regulator